MFPLPYKERCVFGTWRLWLASRRRRPPRACRRVLAGPRLSCRSCVSVSRPNLAAPRRSAVSAVCVLPRRRTPSHGRSVIFAAQLRVRRGHSSSVDDPWLNSRCWVAPLVCVPHKNLKNPKKSQNLLKPQKQRRPLAHLLKTSKTPRNTGCSCLHGRIPKKLFALLLVEKARSSARMSNVTVQPGAPAGATSYSMASLYVGDLDPTVTESTLFEKFSGAGPVLSIRVCRDAVTRISLGYAYVNFQQPNDAERALDTMNFDNLNGKPMRIMWSNRDPSMRRSGNGNIFIKNLDKEIDNKTVYDTFSLFGNILSCKVATDDEGNSKGYGFVHYESEEAAQKAIKKVNGMLLANKKVYVGKFQPSAARQKEFGEGTKKFSNVFVKNFGEDLDAEKLKVLFGKFGEITSCVVMKDDDGKSKGFGFVAFKNPEDAEKAVQEMNDFQIEGSDKKLSVCRAQKKSERSAELKRKFEAQKAERLARYQGVNLYVKNLDDSVDDDALRKQFEEFGKITSAKVMADDNGRSKGFGFVCFEKRDDATKAVTEMNNKIMNTKPLYVALAQRKDDRRAKLAMEYMQRLSTMRAPGQLNAGNMYTPGSGGYFLSGAMPNQRPPFIQSGAAVPNQMRTQQRWPAQQYNQTPYIMPQQYQNRGRPAGAPPGQRTQVYQTNMQNRTVQQPRAGPYVPGAPQHRPTAQQALVVSGQEPLNSHTLAQATPQEQKQMLGERIYTRIEKLYNTQTDAGKITGMMLEMDNSELIMILQDDELFRSKVSEAVNALKVSQSLK